MSALSDMLTPAEAAVVADVSVRDVHRAIDERLLPEALYSLGGARRIHAAACPLIAFYGGAAGVLTAEERVRIVALVGERIRSAERAGCVPEEAVVDGYLTVDLAPFFARSRARRERLAAAEAAVVEDPAILGGTPVFRGTRVPVHDVAASLDRLSLERVLEAYPGLTGVDAELAQLYARAHPPRGRPRRPPARLDGAVLINERRVARRRPA
jgi:uncharacterized protein (DUF433 family)